MSKWQVVRQFCKAMCLGGALAVGTAAEAGLFGLGADHWQEEVLLHDGSKIVVERMVERDGRHEVGQKPSFKEQRLRFTMPATNQTITWEDHYSADLGQANFLPMALDIVAGTPYLVAYPMGCPSYNKWGRPNPPYVVFQYQANVWTRLPLREMPIELTTPNMIFSMPDLEVGKLGTRFVPAEAIQRVIAGYQQPEYRTILRDIVRQGTGITSCLIPTTAAGKRIAPEADGKPLDYNWWPLATEWLKGTYGTDR